MAYYNPTAKLQYSKHLGKYIIVDNDGTITYANGDTPVVTPKDHNDILVSQPKGCASVSIDADILKRFFKYAEEHSFIKWDTFSPYFPTSDFAIKGFSTEGCHKFRCFYKEETHEYRIQGPYSQASVYFLVECIKFAVDNYNDYLQDEKLNPEY